MEALGRMWRGEVSLPRTFWLWGVAALAALSVGGPFLLFQVAAAGIGGILSLGVLFAAGLLAYQLAVSIGVWRSARRYPGPRLWRVLAQGAAVLSLFSAAAGVIFAARLLSQDTHDGSRTSANVAATLARSADYPLTGFWKGDCREDFGLAIEPTKEPRTYSVSFCGPGGCFKPGTYRPNTQIVGDPAYRFVDENTIDVQGHDGFSRYVRCQ